MTPARGTGTLVDPWDLSTALSSTRVLPGHTLWLKGGTYTGNFICTLTGTEAQPISIRPYLGQRIVIDGALSINGGYTDWHDLEFLWSGWTRRSTLYSGAAPPDIDIHDLSILGVRTRLYNCIIHDLTGLGFWEPVVDGLLYGCVIYNIGWSGPDRGHGHLIYTQNDIGTKTIEDCIGLQSFSTGIKMYGEEASARNYVLRGNTMFNSGELYAGDDLSMNIWVSVNPDSENYTLDGNMTYHDRLTGDPVTMGLVHFASGVRLTDNYFPEGIVKNCEVIEERGNTYRFLGNQAFVRPDKYKAGRASVTVYNQALADSVRINVSAALKAGKPYRLCNVQDYFIDVQMGTVEPDGTIGVDMRSSSHSVAAPVLWTAPSTTFPVFGCFVLEPT